MRTEKINYQAGDVCLHGTLFYLEGNQSKPAVMVAHDWTGRNAFAEQKAQQLAEMGYVGFALDMYGEGQVGQTVEEKSALMKPLMDDRGLLLKRMQAAYEAVSAHASVNEKQIAVIGFCFGGLCALDLARSGCELKGAVSFHGVLSPPQLVSNPDIKAKLLVLHGYNDPVVPPDQMNEFCQEMSEVEIDWQLVVYGNTLHSFMNPEANDTQLGLLYNPRVEQRAWCAMQNFLKEVFQQG